MAREIRQKYLIAVLVIIAAMLSGCMMRHVYGKAPIPGCEHSYAAVPKDCYTQNRPDCGIEVRCPDSTVVYRCTRNNP